MGLIDIQSRIMAFRLQTAQRFLYRSLYRLDDHCCCGRLGA